MGVPDPLLELPLASTLRQIMVAGSLKDEDVVRRTFANFFFVNAFIRSQSIRTSGTTDRMVIVEILACVQPPPLSKKGRECRLFQGR